MSKSGNIVEQALQERMEGIRCLLLDVDGVMTDGRVILGGPGPVDRDNPDATAWSDAARALEFKLFDIKDGMAIALANKGGLITGILTGRVSAAVHLRSKELAFAEVLQGHHDKVPAFESLLAKHGLTDAEVAYMGDDIQDLPILKRVGLSAAPADARPDVLTRVHLVTKAAGGRGAVRELVETILKAQGKWRKILSEFIDIDTD